MAVRPRVPDRHLRDAVRRMAAFFRLQRDAVVPRWPDPKRAPGPGRRKARVDELFNTSRWDRVLTAEIHAIALAASAAAGTSIMAGLTGDGEDYNEEQTLDWLAAHAAAVAAAINASTRRDLATALVAGQGPDDVAALFDAYLTGRAPQSAQTEVTAAAGFGTREAAQQTGGDLVKTWRTGPNPRPTHARIDGETVPIGAVFSNRARWPGDSILDTEERAGCNCHMEIDTTE